MVLLVLLATVTDMVKSVSVSVAVMIECHRQPKMADGGHFGGVIPIVQWIFILTLVVVVVLMVVMDMDMGIQIVTVYRGEPTVI